MFISFLLIVVALYLGFKWGKQEKVDEEWRKNSNHEPVIFSLEHDAWKKTKNLWHDFIDSLGSEDLDLIKEKKEKLNNEINKSFNRKIDQLKRTDNYPKKK